MSDPVDPSSSEAAPSRRGRWPAIVTHVRLRDLQLPAAVRLCDLLSAGSGAEHRWSIDLLLEVAAGAESNEELAGLLDTTRRFRAEVLATLGEAWVAEHSIDAVRRELDRLIVNDPR